MGEIARVLGKEDDALYYDELNRKIREAFAAEYISADGTIQGGFQGIYVLALKMNLVPDALKKKVVANLAALHREKRGPARYRIHVGSASSRCSF